MKHDLPLFTLEVNDEIVLIPRHWEKTYKNWSATFDVIRERKVGKSALKNYDIAIDIFDQDGEWRTLVEITTCLITSAEQKFRDTVERLEAIDTRVASDAIATVSESCSPGNDSLTSPNCDRWNPSHFGEVPFKAEDGQLTIFYEDQQEPPEPDDFENLQDYEAAWAKWESQNDWYKTVPTNPVSESRFGADDSLTTNDDDHDHEVDSLTGVNTYKPAGTARGDLKYYRYSYRESNRVKHIHIPGGNTVKPQAQAHAEAVRKAITQGKTPGQIQQMIRAWRKC